MSKYVKLSGVDESQESLVTLVLKADMGGLLSGVCQGGRAVAVPAGRPAVRCREGEPWRCPSRHFHHLLCRVCVGQARPGAATRTAAQLATLGSAPCGCMPRLPLKPGHVAPFPPFPAAEQSALARFAGPLGFAAMRSVLEPVVTSVVLLRDKVEQDRFVVR